VEGRIWYRSTITGERGWLVEEAGKRFIHPDRVGKVDLEVCDTEWIPEQIRPKINRMQAAQVAWDADKVLRKWLGVAVGTRDEWMNMREADRILYAQRGPKDDDGIRHALFLAIMKALGC